MAPTSLTRRLAPLIAAGTLACTEGLGPGSLGQLRLRPVFLPGEEPATLGVSPSVIHVTLRLAGGAVVADTSLPYAAGETTSWLIELTNPPESLSVSANLGQGAAVMYAGSGAVPIAEGIGPSGTTHDLPVHYVRGPAATFSIDVSPDSARLRQGETQMFTAVARDSSGAALTGFTFTWTSSRPEVATVNSATGLVTAISTGFAEIAASAGGVAGSARVAIDNGGPASVVVTPDSAMLSQGGSLAFTAVVRDASGLVMPGVPVLWSSTDIDVATVSVAGVTTALAPGRTLIIASVGTLADTAPVIVTDDGTGGPAVASIVVTPATATLSAIGATQQFTAVALDAQGVVIPNVSFQWGTSSTTVATVSATGLATAVGAGATAVSASVHGVSGSAALTVSLGPGPPALIVVLPPSPTLTALGATRQFTAVVFDASGRILSNVVFTWMSSNPAIASINAFGIATAVAPGTVTITASGGGLSGNTSLTVTQAVHSIAVAPASAVLAAGDSLPFTAIARDANGFPIPAVVFNWSTADPARATISSAGVATGVSAGSTMVTASAAGVTGSASLSVVVVGSVEIQGAEEQHVNVGSTRQFTAIVRDQSGNVLPGMPVTWSTSKPGIASVDPNTGLATGLVQGITYVRATAGGIWHEIALVVLP